MRNCRAFCFMKVSPVFQCDVQSCFVGGIFHFFTNFGRSLYAYIITKQSGISCVTILSKHFCIFLKCGKELKGKNVEVSFKLECAEKS